MFRPSKGPGRSLRPPTVARALVAVGAASLGVVAGLSGLAGAVPVSPHGAGVGGAPVSRRQAAVSVLSPRTAFHDSKSTNWSGYDEGILSTGSPFTSISAEWTVPTATQHTAGQAEDSATWIGIGGGCLDTTCTATDPTLIQAGTSQDVSSTGRASYSAWWEIVPVPSVTASISVHPGDVIKCDITQSDPALWTVSLTDETDGQGFTETVPYPSTEDTAEWIEETPVVLGSTSAGLSALPNLSTVSFTSASVNGRSARLEPDEAIQLTNSTGAPIATPSDPGPTGADFNDCAYAAGCAAP
jgi:hypothetical protein